MPKRKKDVEFLGDSLARLRDFPREAMREAGYQVDRVQSGLMPTHYRPMPTIGPGVMEIKIRDSSGAFRIFYVANRGDVQEPEDRKAGYRDGKASLQGSTGLRVR